MMQGKVWVESIVNTGTTFHFTCIFPEIEIQRPVALHEEKPDLANKKLLIVDDNRTNRKILEAQSGEWAMQPVQTCLLYTSPSPRDQRGSRMPSSA